MLETSPRLRVLESAANVATILACGALCVYIARSVFIPAAQGPQPGPAYQAGDRIENLPRVRFDAADRTLVVATRGTCRFCQASMPALAQIATSLKALPRRTPFVVVSVDGEDQTRGAFRDYRVDPDVVIGVKPTARVMYATPTVLLVNRAGIVEHAWIGLVDSSKAHDIVGATAR